MSNTALTPYVLAREVCSIVTGIPGDGPWTAQCEVAFDLDDMMKTINEISKDGIEPAVVQAVAARQDGWKELVLPPGFDWTGDVATYRGDTVRVLPIYSGDAALNAPVRFLVDIVRRAPDEH